MGGRGQRGTAALRRALASVELGATQSNLELRYLRELRKVGVEEPVRQFRLQVPGRRPVHLDHAWPPRRFGVEVQGGRWHRSRADVALDDDRRATLALLGYRCLPIAQQTFDADPEGAAHLTAQALGAGEAAA